MVGLAVLCNTKIGMEESKTGKPRFVVDLQASRHHTGQFLFAPVPLFPLAQDGQGLSQAPATWLTHCSCMRLEVTRMMGYK